MKFNFATSSFKLKNNSCLIKIFQNDKDIKDNLKQFSESYSLNLNKILSDKLIKEKSFSINTYTNDTPDLLIIEKTDCDKNFTSDFFRNFFTGVIQDIETKGIKNLFIEIPDFLAYKNYFNNEEQYLKSIVEGIHLGNYKFDKYKSDKKKPTNLIVSLQYNSENKILEKVVKLVKVVSDSIYLSRDLVNEPALTLTPDELEKIVKSEFKSSKVKVKTISKPELIKKKMNAILAVGNASEYDPRLIVMHYKPQKAKKKIVLVGKGVTYDSGGLSIKPTSGMLEMKGDMAGAATVVGTIKAVADLGLNLEVIGLLPTVENMLGGNSYKPGDVITSYSGKTIEVKDTDAEGRVILADALSYANEFKPDEIIDFATLTGAVVVALGENTAGLMTQDNSLAELLLAASKSSDERLWQLPFDNSYNELVKSEIADVSNLGPRWGGAITAGKFLEFFVDEKIPWAHIDLAGPALKHDATNYTKKYDTGFGVRLMVEYLSNK